MGAPFWLTIFRQFPVGSELDSLFAHRDADQDLPFVLAEISTRDCLRFFHFARLSSGPSNQAHLATLSAFI